MTELTIKGDIEVLRLQPGDVLVVTPSHRITPEQAAKLRKQVEARFPGYEIVVADGLKFTVTRAVAA